MLPHGFKAGKPDVAGSKKVKRDVETTKGVISPNFITDINIPTKKWFVPQVFGVGVADHALQFILLHIAAPQALAFIPIDLDEEIIDALRLCSVATQEFVRRDCH